jgi:surfactin synthase thioesterase subunit
LKRNVEHAPYILDLSKFPGVDKIRLHLTLCCADIFWSGMSQPILDPNLWCRRFRPARNANARLVCLPHAGGSAPFFLPVSAALSPRVDVVAVQYPGRQDRRGEQPLNEMDALAGSICQVLLGQPKLPLTLFGHSLGAIVGFEVARRLEAAGQYPVRLFASGRRAPSTSRDEAVHLRDDDGILAELRLLNGTASAVLSDDELMRAALPALRADYQIAETYRCMPSDTVCCPITALTGDNDPKAKIDEVDGWAQHTTAGFDLRVFSGGHFFLTQHADAVIDILSQHFQAERVRVSP